MLARTFDWDVLLAASPRDDAHLHQLLLDRGRVFSSEARQQVPILGPRLQHKPLNHYLFWNNELETISMVCLHHFGKLKLMKILV